MVKKNKCELFSDVKYVKVKPSFWLLIVDTNFRKSIVNFKKIKYKLHTI